MGTVSPILCWAQTVPQTRHDGLGEPKGVQPGFPPRGILSKMCLPSLGTPPPGSPCTTGPRCLGRARAIQAGPKNQGWPLRAVHVLL